MRYHVLNSMGNICRNRLSGLFCEERSGKPWNKYIQIYLLYWSSFLSFLTCVPWQQRHINQIMILSCLFYLILISTYATRWRNTVGKNTQKILHCYLMAMEINKASQHILAFNMLLQLTICKRQDFSKKCFACNPVSNICGFRLTVMQ